MKHRRKTASDRGIEIAYTLAQLQDEARRFAAADIANSTDYRTQQLVGAALKYANAIRAAMGLSS